MKWLQHMVRAINTKICPVLSRVDGGEVYLWMFDERRKGEKLPHFRITLHAESTRFGNTDARIEVASLARLTLASMRVTDEGVGMSFGLYGPYVGMGVDNYLLVKMLTRAFRIPKYKRRDLGIHFHDGGVWWDLWVDGDHWTNQTPRWRDGNWKPLDTFLGRRNYESALVESAEIVVPMPERGYKGTVELRRDTWKRPRSPFTEVIMRAHVDMKEPIPVPGKGENSWDCGQDACFGLTAPAKSITEAVVLVMNSAKRDRERHGGKNWKPEERATA